MPTKAFENLLSQLQDFTGRLEEYTKGDVEAKFRRKLTAILITMLEIFWQIRAADQYWKIQAIYECNHSRHG